MTIDTTSRSALRAMLLRLAYLEEERAADEAAATPYWKPCPTSVEGRRYAATALRTAADALLARTSELAS